MGARTTTNYGPDKEPPKPFTVESIKDFQTCELLYQYRHLDNLYEPITARELMYRRFENKMKLVASFFFYKKQSGSIPSYAALLNRWEKVWFPKDMTAYDIAIEQHESAYGNYSSFSTDAAQSLMEFYDDFSEDSSDPFLIDEEFVVPIGTDNRLAGRFDLVLREARTKRYRVIKWLSRHKRPPLSWLVTDFAAMKYAFDYRNNGEQRNVVYGFYDLASPKRGFVPFEVTDEDVNSLTYWVGMAEDKDLFVPRRGLTSYCRSCPFDNPCSKWKDWPEDDRRENNLRLVVE